MINQDTLNTDITITFESAQEIIFEDIQSKYSSANWEDTCNIDYNSYSYKFSPDIELDIYTKIYEKKIVCRIHLNIEELLIKIFPVNKDIKESIDDKIKEYIKFIYNLKYNYVYSRIIDSLLPKESFDKEEKKAIAKMFIKHDIIEDCSVCMEKNTVLTRCKHNLCRICLFKITKDNKSQHAPCPICRNCINIECCYDDENSYPHSDEE